MFSVFKKLGWFFKEHWVRYTVAIILLNVVNVLEVLPPMIVGMAIDNIGMGTMTTDTLMTYILVDGCANRLLIWADIYLELSALQRRVCA